MAEAERPATEVAAETRVLSPYEVLYDYERRSLAHVAGLPEQLDAPGLWRGIGFRIGKRLFVSSIAEVNEILTMPVVTGVPGSKYWMLGIANVRGNLVPIIDLRVFLSEQRAPVDDTSRVLVVRQQGGSVGLVVDEVLGQKSFIDDHRQEDMIDQEERVARFLVNDFKAGDAVWSVFTMAGLVKSPDFQQAAG